MALGNLLLQKDKVDQGYTSRALRNTRCSRILNELANHVSWLIALGGSPPSRRAECGHGESQEPEEAL